MWIQLRKLNLQRESFRFRYFERGLLKAYLQSIKVQTKAVENFETERVFRYLKQAELTKCHNNYQTFSAFHSLST
jgi:CRISPR/Cas system endoribonuclease Cas6 (RAMP superfamily)